MSDAEAIKKLGLSQREGGRLEYKDARGGLPRSFWETYSAFANTDGGTIVLGAVEGPDGKPVPSGLDDPAALVQDLWNALNNPQKVSANLLVDSDVRLEELEGEPVVVVSVPRADRASRPVYVNNNPNTGTYRRKGEGDYRCSPDVVRALVRDSAEGAGDRLVLPGLGLDALCADTVRAYRNALRTERPEHPWLDVDDETLLLRLGAAGRSPEDGALHPTRAGLLMFGYAWRITEEFPQYFLDCRQEFSGRRWDHRVTSASGEWSGNVFDFWCRAYAMLSEGLPVPFELGPDMARIDDTPQHRAVREALTNMLVHADYYGRAGLVALRTSEGVELSNPGVLRLPVSVIEGGGVSDPRNPTMLTMFNLIGRGDKAGSGFDVLRRSARWAGVGAPALEETYDPDRVRLVLPLATGGLSLATGEIPAKASDNKRKTGEIQALTSVNERQQATTSDKFVELSGHEAVIIDYLRVVGSAATNDVAKQLGLSAPRTRAILAGMAGHGLVVRSGERRSTRYHLPDEV